MVKGNYRAVFSPAWTDGGGGQVPCTEGRGGGGGGSKSTSELVMEGQGGRVDLAVDDAWRGVLTHARVHRQRRT